VCELNKRGQAHLRCAEQTALNTGVCLSVVSHGQAAILRSLLDDLVLLAPPSLERLIITCNTPEHVALPSSPSFLIEVVNNRVPQGFGRNHNAAFEHCNEPYFAVCNPDIRLNEDPFPVLLSALSAGRTVSAPAVVDPRGKPEDSARRLLTPLDVLLRRLGSTRVDYGRPAWLAGMFLVFRSEAFRELRGFDEKFFMYCEDADICARAVLGGGGIAFCPQATVVHAAQRASRRSFRPLQWHVTSLLKFWLSRAFWSYRQYLRSDKVQPTIFRSENQ
jgi:GT2 family glycosyltransferase